MKNILHVTVCFTRTRVPTFYPLYWGPRLSVSELPSILTKKLLRLQKPYGGSLGQDA